MAILIVLLIVFAGAYFSCSLLVRQKNEENEINKETIKQLSEELDDFEEMFGE